MDMQGCLCTLTGSQNMQVDVRVKGGPWVGAGWGGVVGRGEKLCTLTRFLKPSMRMMRPVKVRLAALRTSQAGAAIAMTATCTPAHHPPKFGTCPIIFTHKQTFKHMRCCMNICCMNICTCVNTHAVYLINIICVVGFLLRGYSCYTTPVFVLLCTQFGLA